jgi:plastocyanin
VVFLFIITGCSSIQGRGDSVHPGNGFTERPIRISTAVFGSNIIVSPPILNIAPGEGVVWINQTAHNVRINFGADTVMTERPFVIPRHSTVRERFHKVGTYSYTLLFSSSKTFGKVSGEIVVGETGLQDHLPSNIPDNGDSPESPPVGMPEII